MPATIINGRAIAAEILADLKHKVADLPKPPGLAAVLIGDDPASVLYVKNKERACDTIGISFSRYICNEDCMPSADQAAVLEAIGFLNRDPMIHAIIVQLPVPAGFDPDTLIRAIDPAKDVDGFHPASLQRFLAGQINAPPLVATILKLLGSINFKLNGKRVVMIGKNQVLSQTLGKAVADAGGSLHVVAAKDDALVNQTTTGDVLIAAVGWPNLVTGDLVKPGAVVIDVGITRLPDGTYAGDVDAASVAKVASAYTPTPGGVGPVTVAMLLQRVYELAVKQ